MGNFVRERDGLRAYTTGPVLPGTQRAQVPNNEVLGFRVIVMIVHALGKYMITRYSDASGFRLYSLPKGVEVCERAKSSYARESR